MPSIATLIHPDYLVKIPKWEKYRTIMSDGADFKHKYLKKFSTREDDTEFQDRSDNSYTPAHSKAAILEIKNSIFKRFIDIIRKGGPTSYQDAVKGKNRGVDRKGNSMNSFTGRLILDDLLAIGKVGVFIDKPVKPVNATLADKISLGLNPYLYKYCAEDILNWSYADDTEILDTLLLKDRIYERDSDTNLIIKEVETFRFMQWTRSGILVKYYGQNGEELPGTATVLELARIPFVIYELSSSLLADIADHQISLLNLASSDINYALKANFPFYTEQFNANEFIPGLPPAPTLTQTVNGELVRNPGESVNANIARNPEIRTGATKGRRYPKGLERPAFIHPSSEPLSISMEKQKDIREEIRQLVHLAITNLTPVKASAESKAMDARGLEAGLSYIALELEYSEREIASIWSMYENDRDVAEITYPLEFSLKTDEDRKNEAKSLLEIAEKIPSTGFQKAVAKECVIITLGHKAKLDDLETWQNEIEEAEAMAVDPETIRQDHEAGFVGTELASQLRGYPEGESEKAKQDHAERAARIALAQSKASARGVADLGSDNSAASKEKEASRNTDLSNTTEDQTRGDGK
jgi:hypothetical protein